MSLTVVASEIKENAEVISRLRYMLRLAESGELVNVVAVGVDEEGNVHSCWGNKRLPFQMLGAIENTKLEFMRLNIEPRPGMEFDE